MNLDAYRIFTDEDRLVFMAAKKVGARITVLAECDDEVVALNAILEDAGLRVPTLERDMDLRGKSYKPTAMDWE